MLLFLRRDRNYNIFLDSPLLVVDRHRETSTDHPPYGSVRRPTDRARSPDYARLTRRPVRARPPASADPHIRTANVVRPSAHIHPICTPVDWFVRWPFRPPPTPALPSARPPALPFASTPPPKYIVSSKRINARRDFDALSTDGAVRRAGWDRFSYTRARRTDGRVRNACGRRWCPLRRASWSEQRREREALCVERTVSTRSRPSIRHSADRQPDVHAAHRSPFGRRGLLSPLRPRARGKLADRTADRRPGERGLTRRTTRRRAATGDDESSDSRQGLAARTMPDRGQVRCRHGRWDGGAGRDGRRRYVVQVSPQVRLAVAVAAAVAGDVAYPWQRTWC